MKKSEHHSIDAVFRQHFAETAIPIDNPELLWNKIVQIRKKDRKGLWFWFLGTALVLFSVTFTLIPKNKSQNIAANQIIIDNSEIDLITNNQLHSDYQNTFTNKTAIPIPLVEEFDSDSGSEKVTESKSISEIRQKTKTSQKDQGSESILIQEKEEQSIREVSSTNAISLEKSGGVEWLNRLPSIEGHLKSQDIPFLDFKDKDSWSNCEVKIPGHFFLDLYGIGAVPMDKVELQPGNDQFVYRDLWDQRFDPVSSWHAGFQAGYQFPWGLSISAGFEYQNLITKYADNQSITEMITVWDPMAYFYRDTNNDIVWVGDSVTAINIYERKVVSENRHTLYSLPLQVSLELYKKPNFHIAADASAILNISKTYEGQFIRSDQTLIGIDSGNHDNYIKSDIGLSYELGIRMGYYFNDNWEAYLSPRFRYNPNSYLLDTEVLKITRNFAGLRAGLRYHF